MLNHQDDGLEHLEDISRTTKKATLDLKDPIAATDLPASIPKLTDSEYLVKARDITKVSH